VLEGHKGPLRHPALALAVLLLAGCGSASPEPAAPRSERLVDFSQRPPYVNSLERDPRTGEYLLTTNRGFFRVDPDADRVTPVRGTVEAEGKRSAIGTFLELNLDEQGDLVGSGHPDERTLPQYLGYIRSEDGGKTWRVISRLGDADLHKIVFRHDRLYAWDAVLSAIVISRDGGRTFTERFTPRGLIIDFEVDPADPDRILAATEEELFRSEDGGETWRPLQLVDGVRLAWPEPDRLYLADADGTISRSPDGGGRLERAGRVDGQPAVLNADSADVLDMALTDGTILHSDDAGATWEEEFRP
jgi:photosystem II stability/assembly factor-like uncharacterized protein